MISEELRMAADKEYTAWHKLCGVLRDTRAVTEKDMASAADSPATTPGLKLIDAIKSWADAECARKSLYEQEREVEL